MSSVNSYECSSTSLGSSSTTNSLTECKTNLIVNYLPQTMTNDELRVVFQSIGPVESCKLITDKMTQQSLCYGFVNYLNLDDADKAVKQLNGLRIENKVIKVSYARPSSESIKGANLYICGLPRNWTPEDLNAYFGQCGRIITSRILVYQTNGQSKGVGFIRFDQRHEADLAINKLNGTLPESGASEPIMVKFANYPLEIKTKMINTPIFNCDYLNGFKLASSPTSVPTFRPTSTNTPSNSSQAPMLTPTTNTTTTIFNPRYLFYNTSDLVCNNESLFQPTLIANPIISQAQQQQIIQATQSPISLAPGWCLFVYNLYPDAEENMLWQLFGPFGAVQNVKIIRDYHTQKCKGFGFVTMSSYENALNAVNSLNGYPLCNRTLQVSFKTTSAITIPPQVTTNIATTNVSNNNFRN